MRKLCCQKKMLSKITIYLQRRMIFWRKNFILYFLIFMFLMVFYRPKIKLIKKNYYHQPALSKRTRVVPEPFAASFCTVLRQESTSTSTCLLRTDFLNKPSNGSMFSRLTPKKCKMGLIWSWSWPCSAAAARSRLLVTRSIRGKYALKSRTKSRPNSDGYVADK